MIQYASRSGQYKKFFMIVKDVLLLPLVTRVIRLIFIQCWQVTSTKRFRAKAMAININYPMPHGHRLKGVFSYVDI